MQDVLPKLALPPVLPTNRSAIEQLVLELSNEATGAETVPKPRRFIVRITV